MHKFQDFGDYQEGYYSVQTPDGEKIGQLIGGYIDIILKKKRTKDHQGIEGDEGWFFMLEFGWFGRSTRSRQGLSQIPGAYTPFPSFFHSAWKSA